MEKVSNTTGIDNKIVISRNILGHDYISISLTINMTIYPIILYCLTLKKKTYRCKKKEKRKILVLLCISVNVSKKKKTMFLHFLISKKFSFACSISIIIIIVIVIVVILVTRSLCSPFKVYFATKRYVRCQYS